MTLGRDFERSNSARVKILLDDEDADVENDSVKFRFNLRKHLLRMFCSLNILAI